MATREVLRLSDGRDLEYARNAADLTRAVIFHQGTLADLSVWDSWLAELEVRSIGAISFNRSGYANSSALPGRRTVDVGRDVAELADDLAVSDFVSVGWSGGGSHALATGLDPRCRGVVTLAGIAPFDQDDLDFYEGLKADDVAEYLAALNSVEGLAGGVEQFPVLVALAGVVGARVSAAHGDDDVGFERHPLGESARRLAGDVQADLSHGHDHRGVEGLAGRRAGRVHDQALAAEFAGEGRGHLGASGVVHAQKEDRRGHGASGFVKR